MNFSTDFIWKLHILHKTFQVWQRSLHKNEAAGKMVSEVQNQATAHFVREILILQTIILKFLFQEYEATENA